MRDRAFVSEIAKAAAQAMESRLRDPLRVWSLQEIHAEG